MNGFILLHEYRGRSMNYKETGFRAFYHHFCVLPITELTKTALAEFPGAEDADGVLTYGYYDRTAGLTLEVVASAFVDGGHARFEDTLDDVRSFIRIGAVDKEEFLFFADDDGALAKRYADKIDILHSYDANDEVEKTREMSFLDECRHEECIDDVMVYLIKNGRKPEGCWVRISGLGNHFFMGELLNEPDQDFGCHIGDRISFFAQKRKDEGIICISDMNRCKNLTAKDLEDGSMLEDAVNNFIADRNEANFLEILEVLRDSWVWIPCTAVMDDADQARMEEMIKSCNENYEKMKGMEFKSLGNTRLIPDILQNKNGFFFPIFSTAEAMGEYGDNFSKIQKHMLEVIQLARNNEKAPCGIVLNAFSQPFILDQEGWSIVEKMDSRIQNTE
jgi:hypothetical protein